MHTEARGRWRFVLEDIVTGEKSEASDSEPTEHVDRVSLLAVTRGLEALEQPSRVTLITTSRYVARGLQYGLLEWRESDYCWEHFGTIQPIRNADLWRRVDVALRFHEVQCRWMSQESPFQQEPQAMPVAPGADMRPAAEPTEPLPTQEIAIAAMASEVQTCTAPISRCVATERKRILYSPCEDLVESSGPPGIAPSTENGSERLRVADQPPPIVVNRRFTQSGVNRPVRWVWHLILAADAFLVSCVRCLFLLDPLREHFRRRNF
jgi:ribonuclease HI